MIRGEGLLDWKVMVSLASGGSGLGFDFYSGEQFVAKEGHFLLIECAHQLLNFMESGLLLLPQESFQSLQLFLVVGQHFGLLLVGLLEEKIVLLLGQLLLNLGVREEGLKGLLGLRGGEGVADGGEPVEGVGEAHQHLSQL